MLIRFSVVVEGGIEVFSYESQNGSLTEQDPQLIAGFMMAIQSFSETIQNPIRQIQFANMMLYIRTYGDFGLQLLFEEQLDTKKVEHYFGTLSKLVYPLLENQKRGEYPNKEIFQEKLFPVLNQLLDNPLDGTELEDLATRKKPTKIAIVGLGQAGKTSLKNLFFEKWTKDMIQEIKPTIGVETKPKFLEFLKQQVLIMDFGGQQVFRQKYLIETKRWEDLSVLIFVIDIQDIGSFESASEYLSDIWNVVKKVNTKDPKLSIFLHKCDRNIRKGLNENIKRCMSYLTDFVSFASFHLTTIEDNSGFLAIIKTLYFSLPEVLVRRLLEDKFLLFFEEEVLPKYTYLAHEDNFNELFLKYRDEIRENAVKIGFGYGQSLQESWLTYLIGEWKPDYRLLSSKTLAVSREGQYFYITIPDWSDQDLPHDLTTTLLDGLLEGMTKTFYLDSPEITKTSGVFTTWKITL